MNKSKVILKSDEARAKLKAGIDTVADIVKSTLGNGGRNVAFEYVEDRNIITNDGVSIAKQIFLDDEIENVGANILKEASEKTNRDVGDGTTTAILLTQEIFNKGYKQLEETNLVNKVSPITIKNKINEDVKVVLEELDKRSKPLNTREEIQQVALTSVENEDLAIMLSDIFDKVGTNSHISLEMVDTPDTSYEIIEGIKVNRGWYSPYMINTPKSECHLTEPYVLVTNHDINSVEEIIHFVKYATKNGRPLVLVANSFSDLVIGGIIKTRKENNYQILAVKAQEYDKNEILMDLATITNATFIDKDLVMKLKEHDAEALGQSKFVVANQSNTHFSGGYTNKKLLKERVEQYKENLEDATKKKQKEIKEKLEKKIAELTVGSVVINIGANSDTEKQYIYRKVEDAVNATRCALEEGIVKGGGIELKDIAKGLDKDNFLKDIIIKPNLQILENNGNEKIPNNIYDPVKVVKTSLKTAVSVSGTLLTTEAVIAIKRENNED